jgi:hypothetical protein
MTSTSTKVKLVALSLFLATAATVALVPERPTTTGTPIPVNTATPTALANGHTKIEVVFVLDTTGSMGGLIQSAKEKIWSIASTMATAKPTPEIRMGLVAYRDRGDSYVTRAVDLSPTSTRCTRRSWISMPTAAATDRRASIRRCTMQ